MAADPRTVLDTLNLQFITRYPLDAARELEAADVDEAASELVRMPADSLAPVFEQIVPERAARIAMALPTPLAAGILERLRPARAARVLGQLDPDERGPMFEALPDTLCAELDEIMSYPLGTAGRLMDTRVPTYLRQATAGQVLDQLRSARMKTARSLFLVDENHVLVGKVTLQALALASPDTRLEVLEEPLSVALRPVDPVDEVSTAFETHRVLDIPIIDLEGVFLGAVTHDSLAKTVQQQFSLDIQAMVGASRDERALSSPFFTVKKRMPWLQINLLTAFLAAAVVGLFESTIAQVTALAVLLPVVAGQSGNAGAQAQAVTMRGLALREITVRQWFRVMRKEVFAGFMNGVGIALTCGLGVYLWSSSLPLVAVIASSMILAMVAAGFAGALIPIALTRLGQDPATSSSILLTTVTDIAGFFSFLGIATLFMRFL